MKNVFRSIAWIALLPALSIPLTAPAMEGWPQWRGPEGQGHAQATHLPTTWSETKNVAWKTKIPGRGWSSPVVADNKIWLTTAIEKEASKEDIARRLEGNTGDQPLTIRAEVIFRAVCVDMKSGQLLHDIELFREKDPQWVHELNTYASPSPVIEDGRFYAYFGTFGMACLNTRTGKVLWTNRDQRIMHENGPGSSPILWKNHVIFHCDGSDIQYVVALDKRTGKVAWKTDRTGTMHSNPQLKKGYGTPLIIEAQNKTQMISPGANWLYSYDPVNGRELWKLSYGTLGFSIVPRPVAGHGMVFMSTSFMRPEMLAIRVDTAQPEIDWRYRKGVPKTSSPLLIGNELYFISDSGGIVTCLDARSGKEHYRERLGGNHSSSPIFADGKIFFCSREGITSVMRPGATFNVLANNALDGQLMASPVAVDQCLLLRSDQALYKIQSKP